MLDCNRVHVLGRSESGEGVFHEANLADLEATNMMKWSDKDGGKPIRAVT